MNEKIKTFVQAIPLLQTITGVNAAIGVWDKDSVLLEFIKADGLNLNLEVGIKIEDPDRGLYRVLRTGKGEIENVPKEVFGVAIQSTITPIFDGKDVVGAVTYAVSSEVRNRIDSNIDKLSNYVENTNESIKEVTGGAEELKSNMKGIQSVTESVITKLYEALGVVEEIKQNAKLSNILALNASIESARAGEAGKGFAVVSDEMRKFSRASAEASEKINSTLAEIAKSLNSAKENIESSADIANNQALSVSELSNVFKDVSETANQISMDSKAHSSLNRK